MVKEYFFDKIGALKDRFKAFFQHKKKVTALENYAGADKFHHRNYLGLVKRCMSDGFLGDKESDFLDHILSVYEINYLDWSHKTKWLKNQMIKRKEGQKPLAEQVNFDFDTPRTSTGMNIPTHILPQIGKQKGMRV